ncbi:immunoglobulin-like domain-containing protein [Clostridium cochlearium]|uniref:Atrophied bacterial Ig domain-containing protein n=1 Tax=Clostridium cochlearium TaxID=1494 RepID=A0A7Y3V6Z6_CLOCO|nr:immunoglobulin-like domain-containing protein [Clostridium cochlearium]NOH15828.1 hypothetical protein [Clostridium cochlearium]
MKRKLVSKVALTLLTTTVCTLTLATNIFAKNEHKRIYGQNRIETSIKISEEGWKDGSKVVVIAQGYNYADALCASPLAKKYNAPIILTASSKLDENAIKELKRLNVNRVFITGGKAVVSEEIEKQLKSLNIKDIKRLYGQNRYETSLEVAKELGDSKEVFITSGNGYADSLSVAPIAAKKGAPILFADKSSLKDSVKKYIDTINPNKIYIIGGQGVITDNAVKGIKNPERISGKDRFETNKNVLSRFKNELKFDNIYVVQGAGPKGNEFADALSCSALAAQEDAPILLTYNGINQNLKNFVKENLKDSSKLIAIGGEKIVPSKIMNEIRNNSNDKQKEDSKHSSSSSSSSSSSGDSSSKLLEKNKEFNISSDNNKINIILQNELASEVTITVYNKDNYLSYIGQSILTNGKTSFNTKLDDGKYYGYYKFVKHNKKRIEFEVCNGKVKQKEVKEIKNQGNLIPTIVDAEALTLDVILNKNVSKNEIYTDLNLPTKGSNGSNICWESNDELVIDNLGKVNRRNVGDKDKKITLTATISKDKQPKQIKKFVFTVKSYGIDAIEVEKVKKQINFNLIKLNNHSNDNITTDLNLITNKNGVKITWSSSKPDVVTNYGKVNRPSFGKSDVKVELTATITRGNVCDNIVIKLVVKANTSEESILPHDTKLLEIKDTDLEFDHIDLPKVGKNGSIITWQSSNPKVISSNGEISRQDIKEPSIEVQLTATLKYNEQTQTKVFNLKVLSIKESVKKSFLSVSKIKNINYDNQIEALKDVKEIRNIIKTVKKYGWKDSDIEAIDGYDKYISAENKLKNLPKEITISIIGARDDNNIIKYDVEDFFAKSKIKISKEETTLGDILNKINEVANLDFNGYSSASIKGLAKDTVQGYVWKYYINGSNVGGSNLKEDLMLDMGDVIKIAYVMENDDIQYNSKYDTPIDTNAPINYDFVDRVKADQYNLSIEDILVDNKDKYNIIHDLKLLSKGKNGSDIEWTSSNADVISTDGKVTRPSGMSSDISVTLTAEVQEFLKPSLYKKFTVIVKAKEIEQDKKTITFAKELLDLGDLSEVKSDIKLPTHGFKNVRISWTSDNEKLITSHGKVTRPNSNKSDEIVNLTATLKIGDMVEEKVFTAKVKAFQKQGTDAVTIDKTNLTFDNIKGLNDSEKNIKYDLVLPLKGEEGSTIKWSSSPKGFIDNNGKVNRPEVADKDQLVDLKAVISKDGHTEELTFKLEIKKKSKEEVKKLNAEKELESILDAKDINVENRYSVISHIEKVEKLIDKSQEAGYPADKLKGYNRLLEAKEKLEKLPVEVTFSIIGAKIENEKIIERTWFMPKKKLLVPKGASVSDITMAMLENRDIQKGEGPTYIPRIMGIGQGDAGRFSGWIYQGTGIDTDSPASDSFPKQGSVINWLFVGEGPASNSYDNWGYDKPFDEKKEIDINFVKPIDKTKLNNKIKEAELLKQENYRQFSVWKGTWEKMQQALAVAKEVSKLPYPVECEIESAYNDLKLAINNLELIEPDKLDLKEEIDNLRNKKESDYIFGWTELQNSLNNAIAVYEDIYATQNNIDAILVDLRSSVKYLVKVNGVNKNELFKEIERASIFDPYNYSYLKYNEMKKALVAAKVVAENVNAKQEEVDYVVANLKRQIRDLEPCDDYEDLNKVMYIAAKDYINTSEDWKVMDMNLFGMGDKVDEVKCIQNARNIISSSWSSITDLERVAIALTSMGFDVRETTTKDKKCINLIEKIMNSDMKGSTNNAAIFGLIAIDSGNYDIPNGTKNTRESLVKLILSRQNDDGGWPLYDGASDIDISAMALSALAPYFHNGDSEVVEAVNKGLIYLESALKEAGLYDFPDEDEGNSNSISMAIIAYTALGKNIDRLDWLMMNLNTYITEDNKLGFKDSQKANDLSTEQGFRALIAYRNFKDRNLDSYSPYYFNVPNRKM